MKAMLMAAGQGKRMLPLTQNTPKPLLKVGGDSLIERHIKRLAKAGVCDLVINVSHLGQKIQQSLGTGEQLGVNISYSIEPQCLEVGGGIVNALPLLGKDPFLVVNGDIWTDYPFEKLLKAPMGPLHLVLVPNPAHNSAGDFALSQQGWVQLNGETCYTFSGIGCYHPEQFDSYPRQKLTFREILNTMVPKRLVSGELYTGHWFDIGTPERLHALEEYTRQQFE